MAFKPTPNQSLAINRQGNILVSAAAGSGKTAVLVERVIKLLTDDSRNINADELLIVTFTNAAAAEMRSRIEKRIDEECRNHPNSSALLRQKHLLSSAKICTIDSFCIDLVRENFDKLGISPDFKIGENAVLNQINEAVVYGIINRYIESKNKTFSDLVDIVGGEYDERKLAELLLSAYEYSRQLPVPEKWYDSITVAYNNGNFTTENIWYNYAFSKAGALVTEMRDISVNIIDAITAVPELADHYLPTLSLLCDNIDTLLTAVQSNDWDTFYNAVNCFILPKLPTAKKGMGVYRVCKVLKDAFKLFKEKTLPTLSKLFYADFGFINSQFKKLCPCVELFVSILKELDTSIFNEYNKQNTFTFHNIEHLALKLLCKEEYGKIVVSEDGKDLLDQYKEVMVDEYQDTNDLQDRLFFVLSNFEKKLFVVGDVKQSIYAFRGANPINFLNKKERYISVDEANETMAQKIILANNFRTKAEVCDFINYFFEMFMTEKTGRIKYDVEERLIPTATYPETNTPSVNYSIINVGESKENAWVLEARQIANYIREVMAEGEVIRKDDKTLRCAKYGDFTILLRALTNAPIIINELKTQGIPVDICLDSFTENSEISTMLSLLRVIDNPDSDIELLTLLFSPIFSFSCDDLAVIRADKKDGSLYSAIINASNKGNLKAKSFIDRIQNYRLYAVTLKLPDLITRLLIETELLNIISAFPDGARRKNNLILLVEIAQQYTQNGKVGLTRFIEFVNRSSDVAKTTATGSNAVKIMTIHGSKGLQFPVCILAGTDTRFNDEDSKHSACYSIGYGLGFKYFDEELKKPLSTISREVIIDSTKSVSIQDELRLLYVALTRTQDKLLIVSSFKNFEKTLEKHKNRLIMHNCEISGSFFQKTNSFADWLIPSLLLHPNGETIREAGDMIMLYDSNSKVKIDIIDGVNLTGEKTTISNKHFKANDDIVSKIIERTNYEYPFKEISNMRSKTSVSLLANKAESDKFAFSQRPSFMSADNMTATDRGTAIHRVMQYFDFTKYNDIDAEIERLYEWQYISKNEYNSLDKAALKRFFESDIFTRIKNAKLVKREMQFLTEVSATVIDPTLDNKFSNENIIIQGAVDLCFIEDDGVVILDFKTDRTDNPEALANAYGQQLEIYALAAEKIFKMPVKEKVIYSFSLSKTVKI
ncbi:MAG: helicase-exonuclease AddAB subunit AddA [Clostridia bacterium]|nr:helicase-exonuclease AddAB subunit AddA [Clostridia bacterium]